MKKSTKIIAFLLVLLLALSPLNCLGSLSASVEAEAATKKSKKPAKPDISLKAGKNNNLITVTINKTTNASGYLIYKSTDGKTFTRAKVLKKDGRDKRTYSLKKLTPGTTYYIKVRAYNNAGTKTRYGSFSTVQKLELKKEITNFTYFITMQTEPDKPVGAIAECIADKWGVLVTEIKTEAPTDEEATKKYITGNIKTDYICTGAMQLLLDAGELIPLDDYIDKYPEFKKTWFTDEEWEKFRQPDGHIYWINCFNNTYGAPKTTTHSDEAFWIQARVLEWADYPTIKTLDQYFDLIERYVAANPEEKVNDEGFLDPEGNITAKNIPYTILCEDWRYFCLENAGEFLAGYPNDGSVIVNKDTLTVEDYNVSDTTKKYFKKLNEEYQKGIIDKESFEQVYSDSDTDYNGEPVYLKKLNSGLVLGMVDQWWDFIYEVNDTFKATGLDELGCDYVPLGLTINEGMENRWHTYDDTVNSASGIAITKDCKDPDKAFRFIVDCAMDQELHDLRFWGIKGEDYMVDEDGLYYRTDDMRSSFIGGNHCYRLGYFPQWKGTSRDGINAMMPEEQPSEFQNGMAQPLLDVFDAYGVNNYVEMIGSVVETNGPWFPMYSFSENLTDETPGGKAFHAITDCKHEWLPKVVSAENFDAAWDEYMKAYKACKPENFIKEMQGFLDSFK